MVKLDILGDGAKGELGIASDLVKTLAAEGAASKCESESNLNLNPNRNLNLNLDQRPATSD